MKASYHLTRFLVFTNNFRPSRQSTLRPSTNRTNRINNLITIRQPRFRRLRKHRTPTKLVYQKPIVCFGCNESAPDRKRLLSADFSSLKRRTMPWFTERIGPVNVLTASHNNDALERQRHHDQYYATTQRHIYIQIRIYKYTHTDAQQYTDKRIQTRIAHAYVCIRIST